MNTSRRDTGGKLPAGIGIIRNTTGQREHITTWDECREHLLKINRNPRYLKPIVKVQKTQTGWLWTCRICDHFFMSTKWSIIIKTANHHARQHETRQL